MGKINSLKAFVLCSPGINSKEERECCPRLKIMGNFGTGRVVRAWQRGQNPWKRGKTLGTGLGGSGRVNSMFPELFPNFIGPKSSFSLIPDVSFPNLCPHSVSRSGSAQCRTWWTFTSGCPWRRRSPCLWGPRGPSAPGLATATTTSPRSPRWEPGQREITTGFLGFGHRDGAPAPSSR